MFLAFLNLLPGGIGGLLIIKERQGCRIESWVDGLNGRRVSMRSCNRLDLCRLSYHSPCQCGDRSCCLNGCHWLSGRFCACHPCSVVCQQIPLGTGKWKILCIRFAFKWNCDKLSFRCACRQCRSFLELPVLEVCYSCVVLRLRSL